MAIQVDAGLPSKYLAIYQAYWSKPDHGGYTADDMTAIAAVYGDQFGNWANTLSSSDDNGWEIEIDDTEFIKKGQQLAKEQSGYEGFRRRTAK